MHSGTSNLVLPPQEPWCASKCFSNSQIPLCDRNLQSLHLCQFHNLYTSNPTNSPRTPVLAFLTSHSSQAPRLAHYPNVSLIHLSSSIHNLPPPTITILLKQITYVDSLLFIAAAAKSLQSCLTLCDPTDGSPPGSTIPGILQARTLEWNAISFSNAWKWKVKEKLLYSLLLLSRISHVQLCATTQTAAHQAPLYLGFSRQEHWSGLPFPSPMHESEKWKWSRSVVSNSSRPYGLQFTRLLRPWGFPGKSTGVGCHCLLQCVKVKSLYSLGVYKCLLYQAYTRTDKWTNQTQSFPLYILVWETDFFCVFFFFFRNRHLNK